MCMPTLSNGSSSSSGSSLSLLLLGLWLYGGLRVTMKIGRLAILDLMDGFHVPLDEVTALILVATFRALVAEALLVLSAVSDCICLVARNRLAP